MGCVESLENKVAAITERLKQFWEADKYFIENVEVIMKTTSNRQQHLLGDCQYLQKDDETKLALSKFMEQLRALDYDILLDLQTQVGLDKEFHTNASRAPKDSISARQTSASLSNAGGEEEHLVAHGSAAPKGAEEIKFIPVQPPREIPPFVRRLELDSESYYNYAIELTQRQRELEEHWTRLYLEYRKQEEENHKLRRDWRKKKYHEIEKDRKEWEENKKKVLKEQEEAEKAQRKKEIEESQKQLEAEEAAKKKPNPQTAAGQTPSQAPVVVQPASGQQAVVVQPASGQQTTVVAQPAPNSAAQQSIEQPAVPQPQLVVPPSQQVEAPPQPAAPVVKLTLEERIGPEPPELPPLQQRIEEDLRDFLYWVKQDPAKKVPTIDTLEDPESLEDHDRFWRRGLKTIAKGKVALVFLAGELSEHLGYNDQPVGFFEPGLYKRKRLFQIFFERIAALQRLAANYRPDKAFLKETSTIHIYVMTSPQNDEITRKMFRQFLHFGLWKKNIHFFVQGQLPVIDKNTGLILMTQKLKINLQPDGLGGLYEAIENNNLFDEWKKQGIEFVHVLTPENILARPVDPVQIGMLRGLDGEKLNYGLDLVVKYIKTTAEDDIDRIVFSGDAPAVLPISHLRKEEDRAKYTEGFINNFAVRVEELQRWVSHLKAWRQFHEIEKAYGRYYPPEGKHEAAKYEKLEEIKGTNAFRFEKLVYDPFRLTRGKRFGLLEANREEEYAPILRKSEPDRSPVFGTPEYAILALSHLHEKWLRDAGYQFVEPSSLGTIALKEIVARKRILRQRHQQKLAAKRKYQADVQYTEEQQRRLKEEEEAQDRKNKDEDDKEEAQIVDPNQQFYRLVELDNTISYLGENIPRPDKKYEDQVEKPGDDFDEQEFVPFYLEGKENHFKPALPWGLDQIYRYV